VPRPPLPAHYAVCPTTNPQQYAQAVCQRAGHSFLSYSAEVPGQETRQAEEQPYHPTPCLGEKHALVASFAYHLANYTRPEPFMLPVKRLASLLGVSAQTVSRIIDLLEKNEVIKCVKEDYSFTERRAKEYVFVAR
jgi:DNA-binding MarR family transcriptional regulator